MNFITNQEKRIDEIHEKLVHCTSMSDEIRKHLNPVGATLGIMNGFCKVHKKCADGCPHLRPILSALQTTTYKLARYLVPILANTQSKVHLTLPLKLFSKIPATQ